MTFAAAPEYPVFPTRERPLTPLPGRRARDPRHAPARRAARPRRDRRGHPHARAGARRRAARRARRDAHPPPRPAHARGQRAVLKRRAPAAHSARADDLARGRPAAAARPRARALRSSTRRAGASACPPQARVHGGISEALCLVATFPQLEYPRPAPPGAHTVGPLLWEPPAGEVDASRGRRAARAARAVDVAGPRAAPAARDDRGPCERARPRARLVEPQPPGPAAAHPAATRRSSSGCPTPARCRTCDLVVCHGGHGTVARALASGCAVVVVPAGGDMNENAARVDWAGVGVRLPRRMVGARGLRLAVGRALARPRLRARAARARALGRRARRPDTRRRARRVLRAPLARIHP